MAAEMWNFAFVIFGVGWVMLKLVCDLLMCWRRKSSSFWKGCGMLCLLASFGTFGVRETNECSRGKNTFEERIKI